MLGGTGRCSPRALAETDRECSLSSSAGDRAPSRGLRGVYESSDGTAGSERLNGADSPRTSGRGGAVRVGRGGAAMLPVETDKLCAGGDGTAFAGGGGLAI